MVVMVGWICELHLDDSPMVVVVSGRVSGRVVVRGVRA